MAAGAAGEPSTKRAKVEKEEKEDPLVRRKEEVVRLLERASAKGKSDPRAMEELLTLCARLEAKNEKDFGGRRLPPEMWQKIVDENLDQNDLFALAMTCRFFREKQKGLGKKLKTNVNPEHLNWWLTSGKMASHTLGWFQWVCDTFEILPGFKWPGYKVKGAAYEGDLLNCAAQQGSVEILRWLMEEKGCELNEHTGWFAGMSGSVEVLEYLVGKGYEFDRNVCRGAAKGGCLKALKFLRGLDPPCPWDEWTCIRAAEGGHLEVLKWVRSQDPPCPWGEWTCQNAVRGGHLDVLKWLRAQNPPCPWSTSTCYYAAEGGHLEVLKWAREQDPPCPWSALTCSRAAKGGRLESLKWLRAQNPPCPWDAYTCEVAAMRGHLDVLKWMRAQEPPCPWSASTCSLAARIGQLEALKWLRAQNPPCPWSRSACRLEAWKHQHVIDWIDQQEDESDVSDIDSDGSYNSDSYDIDH